MESQSQNPEFRINQDVYRQIDCISKLVSFHKVFLNL